MPKYHIIYSFVDEINGKAVLNTETAFLTAKNIYKASEAFFTWLESNRQLDIARVRKVYFDRVKGV